MVALRQLQRFARDFRRFSVVARPLLICENAVQRPTSSENYQTAKRSFSSYPSPVGGSARVKAYPQYSVHGVNSMLSVKLMTPSFKYARESIVLDQNRRGRILLEFTPRGADGSYLWSDQVRFGLSPEEVGLMCSQLPQYGIELARKPSTYQQHNSSEDEAQYGMHSDMPDKVLKVEPGEAATATFTIDFVKDGIGGQSPGPGQDMSEGGGGPMEVTVQAGEFEVIMSLLKTSIPALVGWPTLVDMAVERSKEDAMQGGSGGGYPRYSGGGGGANVPF